MAVGGTATLTCAWEDEAMHCSVQEATPADYGFEVMSQRLMRLYSRGFRGPAVFRVDYTILFAGSCYQPFAWAPDRRLAPTRRR